MARGEVPASLRRAIIEAEPALMNVAEFCRAHRSARGLIVGDPSKAPKHAGRSWTAERANECWALEDWTWVLADGTEVPILDVLDDHSPSLRIGRDTDGG